MSRERYSRAPNDPLPAARQHFSASAARLSTYFDYLRKFRASPGATQLPEPIHRNRDSDSARRPRYIIEAALHALEKRRKHHTRGDDERR